MTTIEKYNAIINAYTLKKVEDERGEISIIQDGVSPDIKDVLLNIQRDLDVTFDQSYEIVHEATDIIGNLDIDKLADADYFAEADSIADVYTGVQLSYLNNLNEAEISDLMKDESITSIAQACSIWHTQKVQEACEALSTYILQD
jgi:hypothetical protein